MLVSTVSGSGHLRGLRQATHTLQALGPLVLPAAQQLNFRGAGRRPPSSCPTLHLTPCFPDPPNLEQTELAESRVLWLCGFSSSSS